ncbi:vacuolar protein sorting-associated protein 8 homolog isoform X1 [Zingiber officinale]|uniref:vacuolar protein sorting-associated protein 8 homolog isoform X1 n=1 Tax=Zingiber officinale TaxID=94328 RepID=UPI001C4B185F|nr:vacuolar protein sorting-associated protein 8 homolog isoform X1 [Zingiber officinale]
MTTKAPSSSSSTPRRGVPPMELDLDSFLRSHGGDLFSSSSDDDDDDHDEIDAVHRRTVDEILNDSDSSSSSSLSPPSRIPIPVPKTPIPTPDPKPKEEAALVEEASRRTRDSISEGAEEPSTSFDWRRRSRELSASVSLSSLGLRNGASSSSSSSRPLPSYFGGVRLNPKPGAALAAAAAASRSVPTPHAIAIKNRRAGIGSVWKDADEGLESAGSEGLDGSEHSGGTFLSENLESGVDEEEILQSSAEATEEIHSEVDILEPSGPTPAQLETNVVAEELGVHFAAVESCQTPGQLEANEDVLNLSETSQVPPVAVIPGEDFSMWNDNLPLTDGADVPHDMVNSNNQVELQVPPTVGDNVNGDNVPNGGVREEREQVHSGSDIDKLVEERLSQAENSKRAEKKAEKKLRASMKPLEWAEELEKRHASSGLHWEEGAAAQPMRLQGIRRGPPAVGYLQIDLDNAITRSISSQQFKRDHGSPQVVAVHLNYIAVGMSKGTIIVLASKYSAHSADSTDSKMLTFGSHAEKTQISVTSMCFNQQGDLLLAGYGNGHLTIWDVQKAIAAKVITGEHAVPVVHTLFLGQDPQVTRQFKAVTGDSRGLVLLHTASVVPLLNRFSIKTQCLLDGQKTGTVLCASPLQLYDMHGFVSAPSQIHSSASSNGLSSMVGGVVGGVVGGESGWKLFNEGSPVVEEGVVIFVTHQNALVVRLSPNVEVFDKFPRPEGVREGSMPYAEWKWTLADDSSLDSSDKVSWLAIAWDRNVQVAQLVKSEMKKYREWNLDSAAIGIAWLDDKMLVVVTLRGQLCLFTKDGNEIHRISFIVSGLGIDDVITYNTFFSNTFGNPEKGFHNSIAVRGATVYILGPMHLIVSRLLPWREKIQVLQRAGDWMGALDMSMRLYDGHAQGVIDLPRTVVAIREVIMPFLVELILSYVDEVFSYISVAFCNQIEKAGLVEDIKSSDSTLQKEIEDQYARVGGVAVEFCIHISRIDILFDSIFTKFVAVQHGGTFLEILEPYILKDMLGSLPPEIMQALVEHYSSRGWLQRVEQCVLHMNISSLDFNQVVRLCREHGLYGALIYLFNRGLDDYRTPLEELICVVKDSSRTDAASIGYRMLVYLKYCFQGLAFPPGHGTISSQRLQSVREELLSFLLEDSKSLTSPVFKSFKASCGICPNLCYLLWLATEATLKVIRCAFLEEGCTQIVDSMHYKVESNAEDGKEEDFHRIKVQNAMVQSIANTLIDILDLKSVVIKSFVIEDTAEVWPSKEDLGQILEFIAFLVSYKQATISEKVLKHILRHLTSQDKTSDDPNMKYEVSRPEKQVLTLLKVAPQVDWNSDDVMHLCVYAHFYQACGLIHEIRGQFVDALDSYMKDQDEPIHAFAFINKIMLQLKNNNVSFKMAVISRIPELIKLSRECAFFLVIDQFSSETQDILSELRSHPQSMFLFLKTTLEIHLSGNLKFPVLETVCLSNPPFGEIRETPNNLEEYAERLASFPKLLHQNTIQVNDELTELFLSLLCQFERNSVLKFLETFDNYRLEQCLHICQEYGVTDAAAFLLERVGDVGSALMLMLTGLNEKIDLLVDAVEKKIYEVASSDSLWQFEDIMNLNEVISVTDVLHASISLCQRNTRRLDTTESESLWFRLLDFYSQPMKWLCAIKPASLNQKHGNPDHLNVLEPMPKWKISHKASATILRKLFSQFVGELIEGMAGYMPLPVIMAKLLSDNGNQEFGDFKLTILQMLGTYGYERKILGTAKSLIEDDTFYSLSLLKKGASHAYAPQDFICCICGCTFTKGSTSGIRVFSCGHTTHLQCEFEESKKSESVRCPICLPKKNPRPRNKSFFLENGLVKGSTSSSQPSESIFSVQHVHESEVMEKPFGLQQISRFEILNNLQKNGKFLRTEALPQLKLSPPAIYHEKIQQRSISVVGEPSDSAQKIDKPSKLWQLKDLKSRGSLNMFPLRSNIFGPEKNKVR